MKRLIQKISLSAVLASLPLGCVKLEPVSDQTRFYVLGEAPMDVPEYSVEAPRIGVRVPWVAAYLRRSGIVTRTQAHELRYASQHRWAGRLESSVQRMLVLGMREDLPGFAVVPVSGVQPLPPKYIVEVFVSACEGTADGRAVLELSWRVVEGDAEDGLVSGGFSELKPGWDGRDYEQLARLLSDLGREAASLIAADVRKVVEEQAPVEADAPAAQG